MLRALTIVEKLKLSLAIAIGGVYPFDTYRKLTRSMV